jgi:hypothetical protein
MRPKNIENIARVFVYPTIRYSQSEQDGSYICTSIFKLAEFKRL